MCASSAMGLPSWQRLHTVRGNVLSERFAGRRKRSVVDLTGIFLRPTFSFDGGERAIPRRGRNLEGGSRWIHHRAKQRAFRGQQREYHLMARPRRKSNAVVPTHVGTSAEMVCATSAKARWAAYVIRPWAFLVASPACPDYPPSSQQTPLLVPTVRYLLEPQSLPSQSVSLRTRLVRSGD
jgi:hypothetical protein